MIIVKWALDKHGSDFLRSLLAKKEASLIGPAIAAVRNRIELGTPWPNDHENILHMMIAVSGAGLLTKNIVESSLGYLQSLGIHGSSIGISKGFDQFSVSKDQLNPAKHLSQTHLKFKR
jgi:hypothetical protein